MIRGIIAGYHRYKWVCLLAGYVLSVILGCGLFVEEIPEGKIVSPTAKDHFVNIRQVRYHYTQYPAQGRDVLLVHGFASSTYTWEKLAPLLQKAGYNVWAFDLKGFGWSDKPKNTPYDVVTLTEEVNQWMEVMGLKNVIFVGNSLGGGVATIMACLHPDKIERMVLIDAAVYDTHMPWIMKTMSLPLAADIFRLFFSRWMVKKTLEEVYHHKDWITDEQVEAYYNRLRTKHAADAQIEVVKGLDYSRVEKIVAQIPDLKIKTLIIWGDDDQWVPVSSAYRLKKDLRNSSLFVIPACGHIPQEEHPEETARLMLEFINR